MESFFAGREPELLALIELARRGNLLSGSALKEAACRGTDPDLYYPEDSQPDELALARCRACPVRLACLAVALGVEEPGGRYGWWGGLGPEDREKIEAKITGEAPWALPSLAVEAVSLRSAGLTVGAIASRLGRSRRTVQRYLRMGTA